MPEEWLTPVTYRERRSHPRTRAASRRWLPSVVFVVLAATSLSLWVLWLYSPGVVASGVGNEIAIPLRVGQTMYTPGMVDPNSDGTATIDVRSVTASYAVNTADVAVRVLVCRRNDNILGLGTHIP